ncbi:MAG: class I SAM-dependent methyltransferase [Solirubrobacterales bacterium]|nr:class I SAM-dependent methyltransferase [Solirubrobacterales bacterium]
MLPENIARVEALPDEARVLDVGGWAAPLARADVVLDLLPYETRGLYGAPGERARERVRAETWVQHDICAREPFPFADDAFDMVVCSHTLEDVRDPIWVCSELSRIGKAGYVEVPSRLEEQSWGVNGGWVGWSHHHWLIEVVDEGIEFVFKPHVLHVQEDHGWTFSQAFAAGLAPEERVSALWWQGAVPARERLFDDPEGLVEWLRAPVLAHGHRDPEAGAGRRLSRIRGRSGRRRRSARL